MMMPPSTPQHQSFTFDLGDEPISQNIAGLGQFFIRSVHSITRDGGEGDLSELMIAYPRCYLQERPCLS